MPLLGGRPGRPRVVHAPRDGTSLPHRFQIQGGSPMSSHIARKIVQSFQRPAPDKNEAGSLSPRESQVLDLLAKGFLYKEIADAMHVSYATVHTHIRHIYEKLHVRSRTEAVAKHLRKAQAMVGEPVRR